MFKPLFVSLLLCISASTIYDFKIKSVDGYTIDFTSFKGKKILIVNIALGSPYAAQLLSLEQLQQKYRDNLVVVAIPSNSFGKETTEQKEMKRKLKEGYKASFVIAEKMEVKGANKSALYSWLQEGNGRMKKEVQGDFHKYLIDSKGELMGYFIPAIDPMSELVQRAIEGRRDYVK